MAASAPTRSLPVIRRAEAADAATVAALVTRLLMELEPDAGAEIAAMGLPAITSELLAGERIIAFLARQEDQAIGVICLHECAAIYAGSLFGEISELYVVPTCRTDGLGQQLLEAGIALARERRWRRLEVSVPGGEQWQRTRCFYRNSGFREIGPRLRLLI